LTLNPERSKGDRRLTTRNDFTLRERKYAQTKMALMLKAVERLEEKPLDSISVRDLCQSAEISEATFFNYFSKKIDVLIYFIQFWNMEVSWCARRLAQELPGLAVIEAVFDKIATEIGERPGLMREVIAFEARHREPIHFKTLTEAERHLAFPEGMEEKDLVAEDLRAIFMPNLKRAINEGELPRRTDVEETLTALLAIFFGTPLAIQRNSEHSLSDMYQTQLSLLWAGLRDSGRKNGRSNGKAYRNGS